MTVLFLLFLVLIGPALFALGMAIFELYRFAELVGKSSVTKRIG